MHVNFSCKDIELFYVSENVFIKLPTPDRYQIRTNRYYKDFFHIEWSGNVSKNVLNNIIAHGRFILYKNNSSLNIGMLKYLGIDYSLFSTEYSNAIRLQFKKINDNDLSKNDIELLEYFKKVNELPIAEYIKDGNKMNYSTSTSLAIHSVFGLPDLFAVPRIDKVFYNAPYTTVKWVDGTITTVKCRDCDEFNKEIGVAMAITRKYFTSIPVDNPRASFKNLVYKEAIDQSETIQNRKEKKKSARLKALVEPEKEISNGDISASEESSS